MYKIGIDVGSTYTKYCVMNEKNHILKLYAEKTPVYQREYFANKVQELKNQYPVASIVSCGYGKNNIAGMKCVNELTALARGTDFMLPEASVILDIGGQDTKVILQKNGQLQQFFINDKCAAGSGQFLANTCNILGQSFYEINLSENVESVVQLSSCCAVFAQSEIVQLIADNVSVEKVIRAVLRQILIQAKSLLQKVKSTDILITGGLTQIKGFIPFAQEILGGYIFESKQAEYFTAIGAALCL